MVFFLFLYENADMGRCGTTGERLAGATPGQYRSKKRKEKR